MFSKKYCLVCLGIILMCFIPNKTKIEKINKVETPIVQTIQTESYVPIVETKESKPTAKKKVKKVSKKETKKKKRKIKVSKRETTSRGTEAKRKKGWQTYTATAYCACAKCCGKSTGRTASGTKAKAGRTIAAPKNFKFGTKIEIKGMGTYVVEDRGGAIKENRIDIFFDNHSKALKFGRRKINIRVVK